jgi:hypothetical protein
VIQIRIATNLYHFINHMGLVSDYGFAATLPPSQLFARGFQKQSDRFGRERDRTLSRPVGGRSRNDSPNISRAIQTRSAQWCVRSITGLHSDALAC